MKDNFTLIEAPIEVTIRGYRQWYEWILTKDKSTVMPVGKGKFYDFERAWAEFGEIVDVGGVLFASYKGKITYCFSSWTGLTPLAKWCGTRALTVMINQDKNDFRLYVEIQHQDQTQRKIDLGFNPVDQWYFHEVGHRLPFEDTYKLERRNRRDRFDISDIGKFIANMGGDFVCKETFVDESVFYLFQHGTRKQHSFQMKYQLTPAQRNRLMSFLAIDTFR